MSLIDANCFVKVRVNILPSLALLLNIRTILLILNLFSIFMYSYKSIAHILPTEFDNLPI